MPYEGQAWYSGKVTPFVLRGTGFDATSLYYIAEVRFASYNHSSDFTLCGSFQHWVYPFYGYMRYDASKINNHLSPKLLL
jgi:hypothetical protein